MYAIPIVVLLVLALAAVAWSPLFALIVAVPLFLVFLAYVGLRPRADEGIETPAARPARRGEDIPKGAWGEPRA
jgi:hypothetical protein